MYEFTPFKKTDKLSYESFIQFPRELLNREEYKVLSPNAMLLYSILTDRLELSFKQIESNKKIQFYDALGIISILLFIIGWILYSNLGIIIALIFEIIALILAIISSKKEKNIFSTIGIVASTILTVIMIILLISSGIFNNVGDDALINKSLQIQQNSMM